MIDEIFDLLDIAAKNYPIKALAAEIFAGKGPGKAESTLRGELNQQPGHKLGLITAILVMKKTGDLRALDRIEKYFGRVAFSLPSSKDNRLPLMKLSAQLTHKYGQHMEALARVLESGALRSEEASKLLSDLKEMISACLQLQAFLERKAEGGDQCD